ncbi:c-type cytochrome biogenesis protein CcmI [Methylopila turkensis]|uniref:Cytochrome c-type biogenesis protein CycH n=1 Tax=Methylopila turkensis TaxID=1437816 RepID=A0A9W6JRU3_9HYPH|nr:c-type cytochrome biogenesis protein CcmI [Methylopila turkensis]GLK81426.1 cytochrome c-type biogenesis protein CycH [Methylopila turkensis]
MELWIVLAVMTGAAVLLVLWPLARGRARENDAAGDVAVYRDQLDEIERDRARGLIGGREADAARAEIARRLFAATERGDEAIATDAGQGATWRRRVAAVVALVAVPAIALGTYAAIGRPDIADHPLAARLQAPVDTNNIAELVTRVEAELARNPGDGRGWMVLGPVYMRLGRAGDAATAYANAIRTLGSSGELEANLGEALTAAADGVVTADARAAFERAAKANPPSVKGSVYLARAESQDGDLAGAIARLKALIVAAPADAPYLDGVRGELQRLAATPPLPMPSQEEAAVAKTPEERMALIRGMVDRLEARVSESGEIGDWLRLVQSRAALGDLDRARSSLAAAREKFGSDPRSAARLDALALGVGLEGRGA